MKSFLHRWSVFFRRRFEPFSTTLMITAFYSANAVIAMDSIDTLRQSSLRLVAGCILMWLVFLHMRMFDEVKDYDFDREHNPDRPLAQGLISLGEFGTATLIVILLEIALALNMGWSIFVSYSILLSFTMLMRMEFFIGEWLRPRLELYAVTHTFSAVLMGILTYSTVTNMQPVHAPMHVIAFIAGNWFVFNVFEFGRKTFGNAEERGESDSYSSRHGATGAVLMVILNLLAGFALLIVANHLKFGRVDMLAIIPALITIIIAATAGIFYILKPDNRRAAIYRNTVSFYLLAYHLAIVWGIRHCLVDNICQGGPAIFM